MVKDEYLLITRKFINLIKNSDIPYKCVIIDGSVNNDEHIPDYSDIDIKIFLKSERTYTHYTHISNSIKESVGNSGVIFNVWTLNEHDFPFQYYGNMFDYVRRYCLKKGYVLLGKDLTSMIKLVDEVSLYEKDICIKSIGNFLVRLRRILTNPLAISDVSNIDTAFIMQQAIAYYFHTIRYVNAFFGDVIPSIKENIDFYTKNPIITAGMADFCMLVNKKRENWFITKTEHVDISYAFLFSVIVEIEKLVSILQINMCGKSFTIIYH